jgi:Protein of unknown function (DUF1496)
MREQVGDEAAGCYFNDQLYADGARVLSGNPYLRCEHGVWVEAGTLVTESPERLTAYRSFLVLLVASPQWLGDGTARALDQRTSRVARLGPGTPF